MRRLFVAAMLILCVTLFESCGNESSDALKASMAHSYIKTGEDFQFLVVADPHYLSDELHDDKEAFQRFISFSDRLVQYADDLIDVLIEDISLDPPDFLIVVGDLSCNGEMESHKEFAEKLKQIEALGTSVYVIPGNHDILNPMARQFFENTIWEADYVTKDTFADIYGELGFNEAVSRDKASLSYMVKPAEDTWFLMLDSNVYKDNIKQNKPAVGGRLGAKTMRWIEKCAQMAKEEGAQLVAVMHHSLLDHSRVINKEYTLDNSGEVLDLFFENHINLVFTGHIHMQDIKSAERDGKQVYDIATASLAVYPNQYGKVIYKQGEGFDYSTKKVDMDAYAQAKGLTDPNLLDFSAHSIEVFKTRCCSRQSDCLSALNELSAEELPIVNAVVEEMNLMYFAGYRNEALYHLVETEGYEILKRVSPCFVKSYVNNILNDARTDNNILFVPVE